jgi:hypothetical protein
MILYGNLLTYPVNCYSHLVNYSRHSINCCRHLVNYSWPVVVCSDSEFTGFINLAEFIGTRPIISNKTKHSAAFIPSDTNVVGNLTQ